MLKTDARDRLVKFVAEGGSVFTEDWGLKELTGKAWKEYVTAGADLKAQKVDYAPVPGMTGTPLLRGVMRASGGGGSSATHTKSEWKVDDKSPAIKIMDPEKVKVLLASESLRGQAASDEEKGGAVAIYFEPGEAPSAKGPGKKRRPKTGGKKRRGSRGAVKQTGIVLHVLSHFGKQGTKKDEFTLQNLLVNFLLEAQERYSAARSSR
jgi:phage terminase small subunit